MAGHDYLVVYEHLQHIVNPMVVRKQVRFTLMQILKIQEEDDLIQDTGLEA